MRRISLALALISAAVAGCSMGSKPTSNTGNGSAKGEQGVYFYVNLFSTPVGGTITSNIAGTPAAINCGASAVTVNNAVNPPQYSYTMIGSACGTAGQTRFAWADTVVLTATPASGKAFLGWAGDCAGSSNSCTLTAGADKTVVAIFGVPGSGHTNFLDPALHGPAYVAYFGGSNALVCDACHGETLTGQGIAPSCATCHSNPGPRTCPVGGCVTPPVVTVDRTGLVAAITSVAPATNTVTFTLKNGAGANLDVTGGAALPAPQNLPMPLTMAIVNFGLSGTDVLPYKSATGGNPATVTPYAALTSMSITTGSVPSLAPANTYPSGSATQGAVTCTTATPCTCTTLAACTFKGNVGFQGGRACTDALPCTCTTATPCGPALPYATNSGTLSRNATTGVYTYVFNTTVAVGTPPVVPASPFPTAAPFNTNTQTAWLATYRRENFANYLDGRAYTAANVQFNFDMTGAAVAAKRDIVSDAACAKCHDGFKSKAIIGSEDFHSSARIGAGYCNICHYEGRGTNGFADSATFIHRIHFGKELPVITTGTQTTGYQLETACSVAAPCTCTVLKPCSIYTFHGIAATYPQDVRNCKECHDSASAGKAGQYLTRPTIAACGSCHTAIAATFLPVGTAVTGAGHTGGAGRTNASCAGCHDAAYITAKHQPIQPPATDACYTTNNATGCNTNTNAGYIAGAKFVPPTADVIAYEIQSVSTWADTAGNRPQMTFRMLKNGTPVNFGAYAAGTNEELIPGYVGGPSLYWVWSVPQDGIAAPADFNASTSNWLKQCWRTSTPGPSTTCNLTGPDASGWYTIQNKAAVVTASAKMLTGGVGYSYNMNSSQPLTQINLAAFPAAQVDVTAGTIAFGAASAQSCSVATPCRPYSGGLVVTTPNVTLVAAGYTGRRAIVDDARCNSCHTELGVKPTFHAGQRNDGPSCSWCHTPNRTSSQWSANASTFIHGIHAAAKRTVDFTWHAACAYGAAWNVTTKQCERAGVAEEPSIWYPEVGYPGYLQDCTQCHVPGAFAFANADSIAALPNLLWTTAAAGAAALDTDAASMSRSPYVVAGTNYGAAPAFAAATGTLTAGAATTLVNSPIAAACTACHTTAAAEAHIEAAGGAVYQARGAGFTATTEGCLSCHGHGAGIVAIDVVHH